jgi:ribosomal-protein-alanine N-acetyltransferase
LAGLLSLPEVFLTCGAGPSFALGRVAAGEVELLTLAVSPEGQGRGHGRAALTAFEDDAKNLGAQTCFLEVADNNTAAIGLYLSQGYSESGKRPKYYATPNGQKIDALVMMKALKTA